MGRDIYLGRQYFPEKLANYTKSESDSLPGAWTLLEV